MRKDYCAAEVARSVADPWNYSSCIPDGAHGVGKFQIRQTGTVYTGTGTTCGVALSCSDFSNYIRLDVNSTSINATYNGNWGSASNAVAMTALYSRVRMVSAGIKIVFQGNTTADSGSILFAQIPASVPLSVINGLSLDQVAAVSQYYKVVPARQGGTITWRACDYDDQGAFQQVQANAAVSSAAVAYRPWLLVQVFGAQAAGSGTFLIETVSNWEGQFANPTFSPGGATTMGGDRPAEVGWFERAQNLVRNITPVVSALMTILPSQQSRPTRLLTQGPTIEEL